MWTSAEYMGLDYQSLSIVIYQKDTIQMLMAALPHAVVTLLTYRNY